MLTEYGKYYADWYDRSGKRKRKAFKTELRPSPMRLGRRASPPSEAQGVTVADALAPFTGGNPRTQHTAQVAQALVKVHGQVGCRQFGPPHVAFLNLWLNRYTNAFSKHRRAGAARRILRFLWENSVPRACTTKSPKWRNPSRET